MFDSTDVGSRALRVSVLMILAALVLAFLGALILGALVAAGASVPAGYATWIGMQKDTQQTTAYGILLLLAALGVAAILLILRIVGWVLGVG